MYLNAWVLSLNSGRRSANAELAEAFLFPSPHFKGWGLKDICW